MQSQKDHVDADRFQSLRVAEAITYGHETHLEPRARRAGIGFIAGAVIAALAVVALGVYGLIKPGGNTAWRATGAIIVEKDSGSRMIFHGGALHPVRNYASALLAEGEKAHVVQVSAASLGAVPVGAVVGIADAPDVVPLATGLVSGRWRLCLAGTGSASASATAPLALVTSTSIGSSAVDPRGFSAVRDSSGAEWVLWHGRRYALPDASAAAALGLEGVTPPTAPDPWLRSVAAGAALKAPAIDGAGSQAPEVAGRRTKVGALFTYTSANGRRSGLVALRDGLAAVPPMEFALLRARSDEVTSISAAALTASPQSGTTIPSTLPALLGSREVALDQQPLCLTQGPDGAASDRITTVPASAVAEHDGETALLRLRMDAGQGVYAVDVPYAGADPSASAARYLLVGDGEKYPIADAAAATALGFGKAQPRPVPSGLLNLLHSGPVLTRVATS